MSEALVEFNERRYEEARALFLKAHALRPSARTQRALGNVAFELRNYVESIEYLQAALASAEQPLTPAQRDETTNTLARAAAFTARVELTLEPSAAQLTVNNEPPRLQPDGALLLDIGRHELTASLSGYVPAHKTVEVRGGEQTRLQLTLAREVTPIEASRGALVAPTAVHDSPPVTSSPSLFQRWWFWTAVSVVVVGVGAGIVIASSSGGSELQAPIPGNVGETRTLLRSER